MKVFIYILVVKIKKMLNKILKRIHNKYYKFFRFIFFQRYLMAIFFISMALFLTIPSFFNYEKKAEIIKNSLFENYNFNINKYDKIEFNAFPIPSLEINNVLVSFDNTDVKLKIKKLNIYPKILSIYNYENFQINKIILKKNNISFKVSDLKYLIKYFFNQQDKLSLRNSNLSIINEEKLILEIKDCNFANYGYRKNFIKGKIFDKKFKIEINDDLKNINFMLLNSGMKANINFEEYRDSNYFKGVFKSKILNTNIKFNFLYDNKILNIFNSYLRSKNLSFNNESVLTFNPFFDLESKFFIEDFNVRIFEKLNLENLIQARNILKRINSKSEINFKSNKFSRNPIDNVNIKIDLAYGRINYLKKISINESSVKCNGNLNLLEEKPLIYFNCSILSNDKKKFLEKFSIKIKKRDEIFDLDVEGNLNIINKKINFKDISLNNNYKASKEDLKYFKESFENILFDENFLEIFNLKKIKTFILEIS